MKIKTTIATLSLLSVLSFGASAAVTQVNSVVHQWTCVRPSPLKLKKQAPAAIASPNFVKVLTGTLLQNSTNKPSSSKSDDLPPPAGGFFMSYIE